MGLRMATIPVVKEKTPTIRGRGKAARNRSMYLVNFVGRGEIPALFCGFAHSTIMKKQKGTT